MAWLRFAVMLGIREPGRHSCQASSTSRVNNALSITQKNAVIGQRPGLLRYLTVASPGPKLHEQYAALPAYVVVGMVRGPVGVGGKAAAR